MTLNLDTSISGFNLDPANAGDKEFYEEIEESLRNDIDAVLGVDLSGGPFGLAALIKFDKPLYLCKPEGNRGERTSVEWLTESPEEENIVIVDDTYVEGNTLSAVRSELEENIDHRTAVKVKMPNHIDRRKRKNVIY